MKRHAAIVIGLTFLVLGCRELPAPDLSDNGGSGDDGALQAYTGPVVGVITGQVSTPDGELLEGVMVDIEGIGSEITDANGMYRFDEVAPQGLLNVAFFKPGYSRPAPTCCPSSASGPSAAWTAGGSIWAR